MMSPPSSTQVMIVSARPCTTATGRGRLPVSAVVHIGLVGCGPLKSGNEPVQDLSLYVDVIRSGYVGSAFGQSPEKLHLGHVEERDLHLGTVLPRDSPVFVAHGPREEGVVHDHVPTGSQGHGQLPALVGDDLLLDRRGQGMGGVPEVPGLPVDRQPDPARPQVSTIVATREPYGDLSSLGAACSRAAVMSGWNFRACSAAGACRASHSALVR